MSFDWELVAILIAFLGQALIVAFGAGVVWSVVADVRTAVRGDIRTQLSHVHDWVIANDWVVGQVRDHEDRLDTLERAHERYHPPNDGR